MPVIQFNPFPGAPGLMLFVLLAAGHPAAGANNAGGAAARATAVNGTSNPTWQPVPREKRQGAVANGHANVESLADQSALLRAPAWKRAEKTQRRGK